MPLPASISNLSTTPALNSPAGSESPALVDDYLRTHAAFIKQVSDSNDNSNVKLTGDQTVAGIKTFSSPIAGSTTTQVSLTGNETIAGIKTFSSAPVVPGLNAGQLAGMRNKIINGAMQVDQRNTGASQTFTAGAALAYCVDRWYGYCTGANITGQRVALANGQNRYRFTGAASNTAVGFGQRIEAVNCLDLAGSPATLSVKLSSSSLTSITWTAYYANSTDTFGTLASPTRTQIATGTFAISSTEATYNANISVPSAATTGIEIVLTGGALLGTQTLTIGDVQLDVGSVATPFEHRPYGTELALCQRYYWFRPLTVLGITLNSGGVYVPLISFPVQMRATPTLDAGAAYEVSAGNAGTPRIQSGVGYRTSNTGAYFDNSASNWTVGALVSMSGGFNAEL